ncbi:MAG: homoserine dehydrogenase [Sphaerochaetaceae bacterium]|nr:homoserine dehydrogenase [Sphaerochaetaceae bacterium]
MKVAVLGYGTVGKGVHDVLLNSKGFEAGPVLVLPKEVSQPFHVTDIKKIAEDPTVDLVVECIGGINVAYSFVKACLEGGKHIVTSNKALVSAKGIELANLARKNNLGFFFSASCGGAIPFLHNLQLANDFDDVVKVYGILNGTTNYILTKMQLEGMAYADALAEAQRLGYAEADPSADISGLDTMRKIQLACAVAFDQLPSEGNNMEGIDSFRITEVEFLRKKKYQVRLMGQGGRNEDGSVYAYVEPTLFKDGTVESSIVMNNNLAEYEGIYCGKMSLAGQGAGRYPTASSILRDVMCIHEGEREMLLSSCRAVSSNNDTKECVHPYFVSLPEEIFPAFKKLVKGARLLAKEGDRVYLKTADISVDKMHDAIDDLRETGHRIFFAAYSK